MRGADTLIPARFLTLTSHLSAVITLLWASQESTRHCLPRHFHDEHFQTYHNREPNNPIHNATISKTFDVSAVAWLLIMLVAGFASSLALILLEFFTFLSGLTMFSPSACVVSTAAHGSASIALTYFVLDGWLCDWYWPLFVLCSVVPSCVDVAIAVLRMCSIKW